MQGYDLLMLIVLAAAIVFGAWKGLAWQVAALASLFVSYLFAVRFHEPVSEMIGAEKPWNNIAAMALIYVVTSLAIWIAFALLRKVIDGIKLRDFDRQIGALVGAVNGVILCTVITLFAATLLDDAKKDAVCQSKSGNLIVRGLDRAHEAMPHEVHDVLHPYIERLDADHNDKHHPELTEDGHENADSPGSNLPIQDPEHTARELLNSGFRQPAANR